MDTDVIVALIGFCSTVLGGLVTGIVMWLIYRKKNGSEARKTDAETAQLYQEIADRAAQKALNLDDRIVTLEKALNIKDRRIDELEKANLEKECRIISLQCEVDELRAKVQVLEGDKK